MRRYEDIGISEDNHHYTEPQHINHVYLEPMGDDAQPDSTFKSSQIVSAKKKMETKQIKSSLVKWFILFCIVIVITTNSITFLATYFTHVTMDTSNFKQGNFSKTTAQQYISFNTNDTGSRDSVDTPDIYKYYTLLKHTNISASGTLQFGVKACHDAFLFLSESDDLKSGECYEIVIGNNYESGAAIRQKSTTLDSSNMPDLLTSAEYRYFTLSWSQYGIVQLMTDCKSLAGSTIVVNATNGFPFPVRGIGIRTGYGATGQWKMDLKLNNTNNAFCLNTF